MRRRINEIRKSDGGFTLIELLITVVILGVLAGIVVFAVGTFSDDGVKSACKADIKNVEIAGEAYRAKNPDYAANIGDLVTAKYLRDVPPDGTGTDKYDINYAVAAGVMTVTGTIVAGGADCTA